MHAKPGLRVLFEGEDRLSRLGDRNRYPAWQILHG